MTMAPLPVERGRSDAARGSTRTGYQADAASPEGGEGNSYLDGNELTYCNGSCDVATPHYVDGVDLDCGSVSGTYARWQHTALPYECAQSYNFLRVGFFGSGSSWPDNGADVLVYNWTSASYALVEDNVGTSEAWYMYNISSTIGTYISVGLHNVIVELYASGIDCSYVDVTRVNYYAVDKPPECYQSAYDIDFPNTDLYHSRNSTFYIRNDGCGTLSGSVTESSPHFSVTPTSYSLLTGQSRTFTVYYTPQACGHHMTTINTGTNCDIVTVTGDCYGPVECYVSRTNIDFPDTDRFGTRNETFTIENTGCATISGTISDDSPDFSVSPSSYTLVAEQIETFTVSYHPQSCGPHSTTITTDAPCGDISVSGNCSGPTECFLPQTSLSFPDTERYGTSVRSFTIENTGCAPIAGSFAGGGPDFSVSPPSYSLPSGGYAEFEVTFHPQSCGYRSAIIETGTDCADLPLSGTCACCCVGRVGDANGQGEYPDEVTLGDIMLMVDVLFISNDCTKFTCPDEADVNQSGGPNPPQELCLDYVSLGDIMTLVDFLFITGPETAVLPDCL
jgi:hypothetical protein